MKKDKDILNTVLRESLHAFIKKTYNTLSPSQPFQENWHVGALAYHLARCLTGETKRLIITLPPRSLKSVSASVALPAWILGRYPSKKIICVSYSADLALKNSRECRKIMEAGWYKEVFPGTCISSERNVEGEYLTTQGGCRYTTSIGGTLTGRGGNIIIIDDPMKAEEAMSQTVRKSTTNCYDNTIYSRLDNKKDDVIIIIMQRLHMEDLVGHVLQKEEWVHLNLPAIAEVEEDIPIGHGQFHHRNVGDLLHPEREPIEVLDNMRRVLGSYNFSAQYQQNPIPEDSEIFKWESFQFYDDVPKREGNDRIVQSWDTASKAGDLNDYSCCTTWLVKEDGYYLLDIFQKKLLYPELKQAVIEQVFKYQANKVLIEDAASGIALLQDLPRIPNFRPCSVL